MTFQGVRRSRGRADLHFVTASSVGLIDLRDTLWLQHIDQSAYSGEHQSQAIQY